MHNRMVYCDVTPANIDISHENENVIGIFVAGFKIFYFLVKGQHTVNQKGA